MEKEKLLQELEEKFKKMKQELKISANLEDLEKNFFVKDFILKEGFVSEKVSRQISHRIVETFMLWNEYLHSLIMPNPQNMLNMSESKIFDQKEKKEITDLMKEAMKISSKNALLGLEKNLQEEGRFIDEALKMWENEFKIKITKIMKKINAEWEDK